MEIPKLQIKLKKLTRLASKIDAARTQALNELLVWMYANRLEVIKYYEDQKYGCGIFELDRDGWGGDRGKPGFAKTNRPAYERISITSDGNKVTLWYVEPWTDGETHNLDIPMGSLDHPEIVAKNIEEQEAKNKQFKEKAEAETKDRIELEIKRLQKQLAAFDKEKIK